MIPMSLFLNLAPSQTLCTSKKCTYQLFEVAVTYILVNKDSSQVYSMPADLTVHPSSSDNMAYFRLTSVELLFMNGFNPSILELLHWPQISSPNVNIFSPVIV